MSDVPESRRFYFDNVDEFVRAAYGDKCRVSGNDRHRRNSMEMSHGNNERWFGFTTRRQDGRARSYKDIVAVVAEGWLEGSARVAERIDALDVPWVPSVRRRLTWTDQGDHIEMQRVYNGQVDTAWQRGLRRNAGGPRSVRIVVDNCYSAGADPNAVQWRGIAAIAVARALCDAGHNVELSTAFRLRHYHSDDSGENGKHYVAQIVTKAGTMPLDLANVAATTAFSGFFRGVCLSFMWTRFENSDSGGCGNVWKLANEDVVGWGIGECYIVPQGTDNQEAAQRWVAATVAAFIERPRDA